MTSELQIRTGSVADAPSLVALFDEAVAWLVARGQTGQWGSRPFSARPEGRARAQELSDGGGLRIAELDGVPVGALVVGDAPAYVPPAPSAELYVQLLLTSRRYAGRRIGSRLVQAAVAEAHTAGRPLLRVDCWAGAPALVDWYRRQGFQPTTTFDLEGWVGQVFSMPVA
ncbi:MAG TPA: GNAT family N-acetyltransferase [Solirubrobacteraceae bacterium]|jgi:GNAT superfamily N-acetyltransferase|nr:GNAT family N-acetyltransferase [Solirubrobacteraceae bacterium]